MKLGLWCAFGLAAVSAGAQPVGYYRFPALRGDTVVFTAEGDLWRVGAQGGVAQRLTSHPGQETHAAISPDGRTVAFSAEYEGPTEVYTMPLAGGLPTRQTYQGGARVAGWTPDGKVLFATKAFSTLPNTQLVELDPATGAQRLLPLAQASEGVFDRAGGTLFFTRLPWQGSSTKRYQGGTARTLWRFAPDAEEATPLTPDYPGESASPMWWRGRVCFVCERDGVMNLWSMTPEGGDLRQLTRHRKFAVKSPSLDAGRIVYQHGADLRLLDLETGEDTVLPIRLASDLDQCREKWVHRPLDYLTSAHVSPTGDRVALTARGEVFVAPLEPGRLVDVPRPAGVRFRDAQFLDDRRLVTLSDATGELEFWTLPANGVGKPQPITRDGAVFRFGARPSPDHQWLAWQDKNQDLWIQRITNGPPRRVATSRMDEFSDLAWSPDSRWLAYVEVATNQYRQIWLYRVKDGRKKAVTSDRVNSFSPAWSRDGRWLYFLSDRKLRTLVSSPWGLRQPEPFFTESTKIYCLALQPGLRPPFEPKDELARAASKSKPKPDSANKAAPAKKRGTAPKKDSSPGKSAEKKAKPAGPPPVKIRLAGLPRRLFEAPLPAGNYDHLTTTDQRLLFISRGVGFGARSDLRAWNFSAAWPRPKPQTLVADVKSYELAAQGKKLLVRKGDAFYLLAANGAAPAKLDDAHRLNLSGWTFSLDPREEWRQIYNEAWRMLRDYFYDRHMNGVDWAAVRDKYLPLVDRVTDRAELNDVLHEMAGELCALHTFVRYGDTREGNDHIAHAGLGARLERDPDTGGWRVAHIYRADPEYPDALSPLARPGVKIREGDLILAINGRSLADEPHPERLLRNQAGKPVRLEVRSPGKDASRSVIVQPLGAGDEADLRYREWEYTRRRRVERQGRGQIGYVHLRAMGAKDMAAWAREYYPVFQRQGLIIDVRHNRGGNIDSWLLNRLLRKAWFYWQPRVGDPFWNMPFAFRGHLVVLCNERTASDGEAFTAGIQRLGLGRVIGTRTWGGEIWLSARRWLVDRGMATAAELGVYGPEGEWLIEGHGVDPDEVVDNLPHATFKGRDAQLEAALRHLKRRIAEDPRPVPPHPPYPDKSLPR